MKSYSKLYLIAALVVCGIIAIVLFNRTENKENDNVVVMGAILPLTGPAATNGEFFKKGLDMGVEEVNSKGGFQLTIKTEDSKSTAKDANVAYKKLSSQGVQYYIGLGGQFIMGFASETNNSDKILFSTAAPNRNLLQITNRCFRLFPTIDMVAEEVTKYIVDNNLSYPEKR